MNKPLTDRHRMNRSLKTSVQQLLEESREELEYLGTAVAGRHDALDSVRSRIEQLSVLHNQLLRELELLEEEASAARHIAYHDPLTGLANRRLLMDRLQQALNHAARKQAQVALIFIDLNGFKAINDTLGHRAGDHLLEQVAHRLAGCIRSSDTACRYGGDEFVLMLPEIEHPGSLASIREKLLSSLQTPYEVCCKNVTVTPTLGIAVYPDDASDPLSLIERADMSMYMAKNDERLTQSAI